eukprot:5618060-Lingulodinium_polyedra.AAC.1
MGVPAPQVDVARASQRSGLVGSDIFSACGLWGPSFQMAPPPPPPVRDFFKRSSSTEPTTGGV